MTFRNEPRTAGGKWILVADRQRARIISQPDDTAEAVEELDCLECPDAALPARDQVSDQPGYFKGNGGRLVTGDPHTDLPHQNAQRFAREIADRLEDGRLRGDFGQLTLIASPMFLGVLKSKLGDPLRRLIDQSIDKDYTTLAVSEIVDRLG